MYLQKVPGWPAIDTPQHGKCLEASELSYLTAYPCETSTTDLTEGESGGNNRVVYMGKHSALYIHEWTKQPQEKTQRTNRET
jgi:hypothetical protein